MTTKYSLTRAKAARSLALVAIPDENDLYEPFSRFCWYMHDRPYDDQWASEALPMRVHGVTVVDLPEGRRFCVISAEGEVAFMKQPVQIEKILGSGIASPDSRFWGQMESVEKIGKDLFACGDGGQIYRRSKDGRWVNIDATLLRALDGAEKPHEDFLRVKGPNDKSLYLATMSGKIMFNDGSVTCTIYEGKETLIDIFVEDADTIWMCGRNGTLLRGNSSSGFKQVPGVADRPRFTSMTRFNDILYLAGESGSPSGLFMYSCGTLRRVLTGLDPEIEDIHTVDSAYGILWTIGIKDITRFDGIKWQRIDFPGNDPIK